MRLSKVTRMSPLPRILVAALFVAALALPASAAARTKTSYYVALGDSYSQGVQPLGAGQADIDTSKGFNNVAFKKLHKTTPGLKLVRLGCGGATTDSMINGTLPCPIDKLPYKSTSKATSQLTYAVKWIKAHRANVKYVTVSIGGNDFASCARQPDLNAVIVCTSAGIAKMKQNVPVIAKALRKAAGKKPSIVGSTYPDVVLGAYVGSDSGKQLASSSVSVFKDQINPTLKSSYAKGKIRFADTTTPFGGFIPFSKTTTLAPFGTIPVAVANICKLGWYCTTRPQGPDIHLKAAGYTKFAGVVLKELKKG
jgi:lysophospholipase L1-like esterase